MPVKKRTIAGGLIIVGAVLGTFMSGLLPGFGSGSGVGAQIPSNDTVINISDSVPQEPASISEPSVADAEGTTPPDVLEIRIENRDYFVPDGASPTGVRKVDLDDVVKLAEATTGNNDGIRVRILRSSSARLTAWITLHDSLQKAGLSQDSIRMPKDLVE